MLVYIFEEFEEGGKPPLKVYTIVYETEALTELPHQRSVFVCNNTAMNL